ncbi:hypothetical protein [Desulfovibrio sp. UCD-KL4C]|uniref:hypothetical protein n=1 Tax=Desulfovibrio sp. UCD-KL4C TaxID=2578120 RepID=UPI0025C1647E|nr:hypothetical protein [Desulfovibrio sp. UCD-KL4C]
MRIGSDESSISFLNIKVSNLPEEKTEEVKLNSEDSSKTAAETPQNSSSNRPERLNLLQGSFVHNDGFDLSKYSEINLKSLRLENNLMTNFTNVIKGVMAYRTVVTENLIDAGKEWFVAKDMAFESIKDIATAAPDKMLGQVTGEEVKEEAKEAKEDIESRTEEVIEKKQEETKTEAKESEAEAKTATDSADDKIAANITDTKASDNITETGNAVQTAQSVTEVGSNESKAGVIGVKSGAPVSTESTPVDTDNIVSFTGVGKKVDVLV